MEESLRGVRYEEVQARTNEDPDDPKYGAKKVKAAGTKGATETKQTGVRGQKDEAKKGELKRRKVDKKEIGPPTGFR